MPNYKFPIPDEDRVRLGANIKKGRLLNKLTQEKLAIHIGSTINIVSQMENKPYLLPDVFSLVRMAQLYGTSLKELVLEPNESFLGRKTPANVKMGYEDRNDIPKERKAKRLPISKEDRNTLRQNIKTMRRLTMSQTAFAEKIDLKQRTVSDYECGNNLPNVFICIKMADVLDTTVEEMVSPLSDIPVPALV